MENPDVRPDEHGVDYMSRQEWHRPVLQKLPIAATASGAHLDGNDGGNLTKSGKAGSIS